MDGGNLARLRTKYCDSGGMRQKGFPPDFIKSKGLGCTEFKGLGVKLRV